MSKLLDQLRAKIRLKHYSIRTEETYVQWCKRFILFHHKRHPTQIDTPEANNSSPPWPICDSQPIQSDLPAETTFHFCKAIK